MSNPDKETASKLQNLAKRHERYPGDFKVKRDANEILCELLVRLGYTETVTEYRKIERR